MNTKFNLGDTVWWITPKQEIREGVIGIIQIIREKEQPCYRVFYDSSSPEDFCYYWLDEDSLYVTKEEATASIRKLKCPSLGKLAFCISPVYGSAADNIISYKVEKVVPIECKAGGVSALVYVGQMMHVKYVSFNDLYDDEAGAMLEAANRINRNSRKGTNSGLRSYASTISRLIQDRVKEVWEKIFPESKPV